MKGRVPSARFWGLSELAGHELRFHKRGWQDGTAKANAYATGRPGDAVHGVIWEIDPTHLQDLDRHEGLGLGYERRLYRFEVRALQDRSEVDAWIYLAELDAIDDTLLPKRWYLEHVVRGVEAHGLPRELLERLERIVTSD